MINIAGQLHAATAEGVLASSSEILDEAQNKSQAQINAEMQAAIKQQSSTEIDEDEIDAIINGVDPAAPYITFYSEAEDKTETAYRYAAGDVSAGESELNIRHTCFARVDGQRFYLREGVWNESGDNKYSYYGSNLNVYPSLTAELFIGTAEPHGFECFRSGGATN